MDIDEQNDLPPLYEACDCPREEKRRKAAASSAYGAVGRFPGLESEAAASPQKDSRASTSGCQAQECVQRLGWVAHQDLQVDGDVGREEVGV